MENKSESKMKAIIFKEYGNTDVLSLQEVEKPSPKKNEVLIKVVASSINAGDHYLMTGTPWPLRLMFGLTKPSLNILGCDVAGVIEAVGKDIKHFKVGDEIYGDLSSSRFGGFAEYTCAKETSLARKPANLSFEQAAAIPSAALTALQGLRDHGHITAGQKVLINGASGGVGTYAVQIAKSMGAHVTAVCSTRKSEMVSKLSPDEIIDYKTQNFTENGKHYDLIHAVNGYHPISAYKNSLTPTGNYVMSGGDNSQLIDVMLKGPFLSSRKGQTFKNYMVKPNRKDLDFLRQLAEDNELVPVVDRTLPLQQVPDAIRSMEKGEIQGKIVIKM